MSDHVERNQEWASVLRAELGRVWDGYTPNLTQQLIDREAQAAEQGDRTTTYDTLSFSELEQRRAARRAEIASRAASDQRGA